MRGRREGGCEVGGREGVRQEGGRVREGVRHEGGRMREGVRQE